MGQWGGKQQYGTSRTHKTSQEGPRLLWSGHSMCLDWGHGLWSTEEAAGQQAGTKGRTHRNERERGTKNPQFNRLRKSRGDDDGAFYLTVLSFKC